VHAVLERRLDQPAKERTHEAAPGLLRPQWEQLVAAEPELSTLFPEDGGAALGEWLGSADELVARWFELEDPTRLEPAERELYVETTLDDGLVLRGYVDRLDVAPTGALRVVDYKTGRSPSEYFETKALFQMRFYALVLWRTRGVVPRLLQLVYLGDSQILRYEPDEADLLATERKVKALWAAIERAATTGDWRPNRGKLCEWCDHQAICPAWGGTPPALPDRAVERALDPAFTGQDAAATE
jgi:putative RecB family exonuclease